MRPAALGYTVQSTCHLQGSIVHFDETQSVGYFVTEVFGGQDIESVTLTLKGEMDTVAFETQAIMWCSELFHNADRLFPMADDVLVRGFELINGCSGFLTFLASPHVEIKRRVECVESMFDLFSQLFSIRPLGHVCFMWFEQLLTWGYDLTTGISDVEPLMLSILETEREILRIGSDECKRSALHGLNHMVHMFPSQVASVIDEYIGEAGNQLDPPLVAYAWACRQGGEL